MDVLNSFVDSTEGVQSFLNLYKSNDCLTVPDMFGLYFYIPRAGSDTSGSFEFEFSDRTGLRSREIKFDVTIGEYVLYMYVSYNAIIVLKGTSYHILYTWLPQVYSHRACLYEINTYKCTHGNDV